jgi:diguanylate cyclase (GGDEF)-like protein
VYGNRATLELFGCTGEALAGRDDHSFFAPETAARIRAIDRQVLAGETTREELEVRGGGLADERVFWQEKAPIYADAARRVVWGLCGVSTTSPPASVWSGRSNCCRPTPIRSPGSTAGHIFSTWRARLARLRRHPAPMALVMLDLDHFKRVNSRYGHGVGDRVLVAFARVCRQNLREIDLMGRLGGEFAVLLPDTGGAQAREVVERLLGAVAAVELRVDGRPPIRMTASAGLAICGEGDGNMDALLNRADAALYEAKRLGRNRWVVAAGVGPGLQPGPPRIRPPVTQQRSRPPRLAA